jgi:lipase ATG15
MDPDLPILIASDDGSAKFVTYLTAQSQLTNIQRMKDRRPSTIEPLLAAARELGYPPPSSPSAWTIESVMAPDISHKETIVNLAEMAANAYAIDEDDSDWNEINEGFNRTGDFGWETDGLRGHVYADETNSTIIIGIKGTTPGWSILYWLFM